MNHDRDLAYIEELMRLDQMPKPHELKEGGKDFSKVFNARHSHSQTGS
jgi:hypothetical protein